MKLLLVFITLILLSGCSQRVSNGDIEEAISTCENHGGINHIYVDRLRAWIYCQDNFSKELVSRKVSQ